MQARPRPDRHSNLTLGEREKGSGLDGRFFFLLSRGARAGYPRCDFLRKELPHGFQIQEERLISHGRDSRPEDRVEKERRSIGCEEPRWKKIGGDKADGKGGGEAVRHPQRRKAAVGQDDIESARLKSIFATTTDG